MKSKECCEEIKGENARLEKEKEELKREIAICLVCGINCTEVQHKKKVSELKRDSKKLNGFFSSLEKNGKQVTLKAFFH